MNKEKKMIPELRFPEFYGEWVKEELEQCLDYLQPTPYLVESTNYKDDYETPVLTAGKSFILGYTDEKEGIFNENLPVIIFDDFTTDSKFVDFPFKAKSSAMKILLAKKGKNIKFVFESMQTLNYEVGVHKRHWISVFSKLKIPVPKPQEQQKIASCLSSLDELIAAHNDKLDALKDHKKGLMQNLFPQEGEKVPKLRFPECEKDGEWIDDTFGNRGIFTGGGTPSKSIPDFWKGNFPWVSSSDISENSIHQIEITRFITEDAIKNSAAKIVPKNSLLIVSRVGVGKVAVTKEKISTSQDFTNFTPKKDDVEFLGYYLKCNSNILLGLSQGMAIKGFTKNDISTLKLAFPVNPKEQQKIASCLSALDELIKVQSEKMEQLQQHKKGLMQGLFPKVSN